MPRNSVKTACLSSFSCLLVLDLDVAYVDWVGDFVEGAVLVELVLLLLAEVVVAVAASIPDEEGDDDFSCDDDDDVSWSAIIFCCAS